jgi:DNA-binding NtrC family response regulator
LPPCLTAADAAFAPHDAPNLGARNRERVVTDNWRMLGEEMRNAFGGIIGDDPALRQMLGRAALVAPTTTPVLVMGESGTGKELLARALHALGPHPGGPFVAVNCGALPRELAESELFGHERGSFTGAGARRAGWFEEASAGTLVLDEIGELPLDLQPKLLRVLESGRLRRVGGTGEVVVRARIIAMTLRNLEGEVQRRTFRPDLYYRLAGICLRIPPLRERRNDIPALALHFLNEIAPEVGVRTLDPDAMAALVAADWPGNVRELRNVIRRSAILTRGRTDGRITADALELPPAGPFRLAESPGPEPEAAVRAPPVLDDAIRLAGRTFDEIEREVFSWALRRNAGSRRRAARALAVARSTFCDKVRRYSL